MQSPERRVGGVKLPLRGDCGISGGVESPEGISPPGAPRTVRDPLESHGSRCSAVALNGFASSTGSSRFQLANGQGRTTQPLRSNPITGPSTLLRAAPPLRSASVLSPSRLEPLAASPFTPSARQSTGSHVPYESLVELRAAYMPDVARGA